MAARGFRHHSPLDAVLATGSAEQAELVETLADQRALLVAKDRTCRVV